MDKSQTVTVIQAPDKLLTKVHGPQGTQPYDRPFLVSSFSETCTNIHELSEFLTVLSGLPDHAVIRGSRIEATENIPLVRRAKWDHPAKGIAGFEPEPKRWLCVDIDKLVMPEGQDPGTDPDAVAAWACTQLPAWLQDVTFHYQWSASAGVPNWYKCKIHLWFWMDRPIEDVALRTWAETTEYVDPALYDAIQIHYTADPKFQPGSRNPLPQGRCGLVQGAADVAVVPEDLKLWAQDEQARRAARRAARPHRVCGVAPENLTEARNSKLQSSLSEWSNAERTAWVLKTVSDLTARLEDSNDGDRHMTALRVSGSLANIVSWGWMTEETAMEVLNRSPISDIPDRDGELERVLEHSIRMAEENPCDPPTNVKSTLRLEDIQGAAAAPETSIAYDLPVIVMGNQPLDDMEAAAEALRIRGRYESTGLFRRGEALAALRADRDGQNGKLVPITVEYMQGVLAKSATWQRYGKEQELVASKPSKDVSKLVMTMGVWGNSAAPPVTGITRSPVLRSDGKVQCSPGFDESTQLIYLGEPWDVARVPVAAAVALLQDMTCDVLWDDPAGFSAFLSLIMTMVSRNALGAMGAAPVFGLFAHNPGVGKSLLADIATIIATGERQEPVGVGNPDTMKTLLFSMAIEGAPTVFFDNVQTGSTFGNPVLESLVTQGTVKDRLYFTQTTASVRWATTIMVSGNNLSFGPDMLRRIIPIALRTEEGVEPDQRCGFKRERLLEWVHTNRKGLLDAVLSILMSYVEAGRPKPPGKYGSFEAWYDLVAGACVWAGLPDPTNTRKALKAVRSPEQEALESYLACTQRVFGVLVPGASTTERDAVTFSASDLTAGGGVGKETTYFNAMLDALAQLANVGARDLGARQVAFVLAKYRGVESSGLKLTEVCKHPVSRRTMWALVQA